MEYPRGEEACENLGEEMRLIWMVRFAAVVGDGGGAMQLNGDVWRGNACGGNEFANGGHG
ncbi:hypothetical protein SESBI_00277 [Sesbania bispinosa]|nr:hypothetical protein SESBI_00277 [Sesbania bispinosa]